MVRGAAAAAVVTLGLGAVALTYAMAFRDGPGRAEAQTSSALTQDSVVAGIEARLAVLTATLDAATPKARPAILSEIAMLRAGLADPVAALAAAQALNAQIGGAA